jgi:outer membrane protein assembly factor BamB
MFLIVAMAATPGADWPQHRGPNRNGITSEQSGWNGRNWPIGKVWQTRVGDGCTSPLLVGGKVYVMGWAFTSRSRDRRNPNGRDTVSALDATTGKTLWTQSYDQPRLCRFHDFDESGYGGPSSTPTFDLQTGLLFTHGIDGDFRCLDTNDGGKVLWQMNIYDRYTLPKNPEIWRGTNDSDHGCNSSPLLYGNWVIIEVGSPKHGTVIAYDKRTGHEAWASELKTWAGETPGPQLITVGGVQCLATLTLENLVIMRLDTGHEGKTLSKAPWKAGWNQNIALPAVDGNHVLLTGYHWINGGRNDGASAVFEVSAEGIRRLWKKLPCSKANGGTLYRGYAYIGSDNLHCVDMRTGNRRWMDPDVTGDDFGCGASVVITGDDKLLYLSEKNTLYLVEPGHRASRYERLAKVPGVLTPTKGHTWPHVALATGKILVKDKSGNLACYGIGAAPEPRTDGGAQLARVSARQSPAPPPAAPRTPPPIVALPSGTAPLRYWSFDRTDDGLTSHGAEHAEGRTGTGMRFDGDDDYVDAGTFDIPGTAMTLCAWVKPEEATRPDPRIISKAVGWGEQDHYWMLGFTGSTEKPLVRFRLKTGGRTTTLQTGTDAVPLERWTHLAAIYDGREMRIYQDGRQVASTRKTGMIDSAAGVPVWIGGNPPKAADRPYHGTIDEIRICARPLAEGELQRLARGEELQAALPWPRFRGPDGAGKSEGPPVPSEWNEATGRNIAWKSPVPLVGAGSPILCDDCVILTGAGKKAREVYGFDPRTGKMLWRTSVCLPGGDPEQEDEFEGMTYAGGTPVTDGTHVFVAFGNGTCACLDSEGQVVWVRSIGLPATGYSYCTSPILHGDRLVLDVPAGSDAAPEGKLLVLSKTTGKTIWEKSGDNHPAADSWATPIIVRTSRDDRLVTRGGGWVIARDAVDGRKLWQVPSETGDVSTSPIHCNGLIVSAGYGGKTEAIGIDGRIAWSTEDAAPDVATPLEVNGVLILVDSAGLLTGLRRNDGHKLFEVDMAELHDGMYYASPVLSGERVYLLSDEGVTLGFAAPEPGDRTPPRLSIAGRFKGQKQCWATPAITGGRMYIRSSTHLYCVASPGRDAKAQGETR